MKARGYGTRPLPPRSISWGRGPADIGSHGITLIELMVVMAIVGILAVALGFEYRGWMGAYKVERAINDIYSDLTTANVRAMTRSRAHFVDFPSATTYRIVDDTNPENGVLDGTDPALPTYPKTVEYPINWAGGTLTFDRSGRIQPQGTLRLTTTNNADYDCIVISQTRINEGKWDGATCVTK